MLHRILFFCYLLGCCLFVITYKGDAQQLANPITEAYLKNHLPKKAPFLILTPKVEQHIKFKLKSDPLVQKYYQALAEEANNIMQLPLLERKVIGFRMLQTAAQFQSRMSDLCMVYRIGKQPAVLQRINDELVKSCNYPDWNPQHFLDVASMAVGVALTIDWVGDYLPKETVKLAKVSLIEKVLLPGFNEEGERMGWVNGRNNWTAICHTGMIAAALKVADINPSLAAKSIARALDKLPRALNDYGPDGIYPEGASYWNFGTSFMVLSSSMLTSAFGTDFGIANSPGFLESARFIFTATAPSGNYFNFADCNEGGEKGSILHSWFAGQTGDGLLFNKSFFEKPKVQGRLAGPGLVWLTQYTQTKRTELPLNWHGKGINPVAVFRTGPKDPGQFYLAVKGGSAAISHGNMDAGSFIFELNGVRWVIDPGNQEYEPLNKIGFQLANYTQVSERWTLLTKSNLTHSTISVNNERFKADGYAPIIDFKEGALPETTIDMSDILQGQVATFHRRFVKESDQAVLIEDKFETNDSTRFITWQIMTLADVEPVKDGAILKQDGKELKLTIVTPGNLAVSISSLDPAPLAIDKTIKNLKKIEIRVPVYILNDKKGLIKVRLSGG